MNKNYLLRRIEGVEQTLEGSTAPANKAVLDKFSEQPAGTLLWDGEAVSGSVGTVTIADVTGLQGELDGKAATGHSHIITDVTGLQGALDGKASASHTHIISEVTGLESALNSKADSTELHSHANKAVLDSLSDVGGSLLYNGSAIGVTSFSDLTDVPAAYGTPNQILVVNATQDGLEYADAATGGGASEFDTLSDTPANKVGSGGKFLAVNTAEDALEYVDAPAGGGGGGGTAWTSFTLVVRTDRIPSGDIVDNQCYWRETSDGDIEMYGLFNWFSSAANTVIFISLPFFADIDFKGMGYLPVSISGGENRAPLPLSGGWYGGLRDNGFFELKNQDSSYPNVNTGGAPRGFSFYGKFPKLAV